jgi:hypothetical protein
MAPTKPTDTPDHRRPASLSTSPAATTLSWRPTQENTSLRSRSLAHESRSTRIALRPGCPCLPRRQAAVMVRLNNVRMRSMLILLIQLLCTCTGIEEPQQPPPPSPLPQKQPVECGRLGHCSEPTGLRDPDELHEVRTGTMHSPAPLSALCVFYASPLCMLYACAPRPHTHATTGAVLHRRQDF